MRKKEISKMSLGKYILKTTVLVFSVWLLATMSAAAFFSTPAQAAGKNITIPVSTFADGQARVYKYQADNGVEIRYFIVQSKAGKIRAAFDACDVCWKANRGYSQDGDEVICNNCGLRFPIKRIGFEKGGCNPSPLKFKVKNGQVVIKASDLLEGRRFFTF